MKRALIQICLIIDWDNEAEQHYQNNPEDLFEAVCTHPKSFLQVINLVPENETPNFAFNPDLNLPQ